MKIIEVPEFRVLAEYVNLAMPFAYHVLLRSLSTASLRATVQTLEIDEYNEVEVLGQGFNIYYQMGTIRYEKTMPFEHVLEVLIEVYAAVFAE